MRVTTLIIWVRDLLKVPPREDSCLPFVLNSVHLYFWYAFNNLYLGTLSNGETLPVELARSVSDRERQRDRCGVRRDIT